MPSLFKTKEKDKKKQNELVYISTYDTHAELVHKSINKAWKILQKDKKSEDGEGVRKVDANGLRLLSVGAGGGVVDVSVLGISSMKSSNLGVSASFSVSIWCATCSHAWHW